MTATSARDQHVHKNEKRYPLQPRMTKAAATGRSAASANVGSGRPAIGQRAQPGRQKSNRDINIYKCFTIGLARHPDGGRDGRKNNDEAHSPKPIMPARDRFVKRE